MIEIHVLDTPSLGDRSYLVSDGEVAVAIDPQRDIDRVLDLARCGRGPDHPRRRDAHPQRLRDRRAGPRAPGRRGVPRRGRRRRRVRPAPGPRRRRDPHRAAAAAGAAHAGAHLHPPGLRARGRRPAGARGVHRWLAALRVDRPAGPPRAPAHRDARPAPARVGAPARRRPARRHPGVPDPRLRQLLLPRRRRTGRRRRSPRSAGPTRPCSRTRTRSSPGCSAGLDAFPAYYAHMAPLNAAGPAPVEPTLPERVDPAELRRRIRAGEWVVDLRRRAAFAAGHLPGVAQLRARRQLPDPPGLADPLGDAAVAGRALARPTSLRAVRELCRIGIDRAEAMTVGNPVEWGGGPIAAFQRVTFADLAAVRAGRPPAVRARRPACGGAAGRRARRDGARAAARAAGPARRAARRPDDLGALRGRLPGVDRGRPPGGRPAGTSS